MPTTTRQYVQPNHATANNYDCQITETAINKRVIARHKPITWPQNPAAHQKIVPIDHVEAPVSVHQVPKEV